MDLVVGPVAEDDVAGHTVRAGRVCGRSAGALSNSENVGPAAIPTGDTPMVQALIYIRAGKRKFN